MSRRIVLTFTLVFVCVCAVTAQDAAPDTARPDLAVVALPVAAVPMFTAAGVLAVGPGAHLSLWYAPFRIPLYADFTASYATSRAVTRDGDVSTIAGGLGALYRYPLGSRLALRAGGRVSYGYSTLRLDGASTSGGAIGWWGALGVDFALSDVFALTVEADLTGHDNTYTGLETGVGLAFRPNGLPARPERENRPRATDEPFPTPLADIAAEDAPDPVAAGATAARETVENRRADLQLLDAGFDVVFPVFYRYYDTHQIGSATLRNQSRREITDIELVINIPRFMDVPQRQSVVEKLAPGESVDIPIQVLFNDGLLEVTEGTRVAGELLVSYELNGKSEDYAVNAPLDVADRNAMTWDDDRKAASFVTAKDPAVLSFARNVSSVVRSVGYETINTPLRTGMAMLEAMALHGINYVVDPTSPYAQFADQPYAVDFLQFPQQTFEFKAGDCDDLSICYAANLEAVGVQAAFITIPGHIYAAFSTGLTAREAEQVFSRMDKLIIHEDMAWVPVETTLLQDGFARAWEIGARQWRENVGRDQAALIPIEAAWSVYEPIGLDRASRATIDVPAASQIEFVYGRQLRDFIDAEIGPQIARLRTRIEATGDPRQMNRLGVLYARYGMFEEATAQFMAALADGPYAEALLNLGHIEFLREDYFAAADYFDEAEQLAPESPIVLLAVAKVNHELENYGTSGRAYAQLQQVDPVLASDFEYLQFRGTDAARASDAADKKYTIIWGEDEE